MPSLKDLIDGDKVENLGRITTWFKVGEKQGKKN